MNKSSSSLYWNRNKYRGGSFFFPFSSSYRKIFLLVIAGLCSLQLSAQKEDHQWIYNWTLFYNNDVRESAGASVLDFNTLPPTVYKDSDIFLDMKEAHAAMCDAEGQLLYLSNGQEIHGPHHEAIENGDTINYGYRWEVFTSYDQMDNLSTTGFRGPQEVAFVPQPSTDTILTFYINNNYFLLDTENNGYQLWMGKIVAENGVHRLVTKDEVINENLATKGKLTACRHGNGRDWWLLQFNRDTVYNYLIDPTGIHLHHMQLLPFSLRDPNTGQAKFSPQGDRFASHGVHRFNATDGLDFMIADFDRCSGDLLNPKLQLIPSFENELDNGVEFSLDGKLLYINRGFSIRQYDLEADDVFGSKMIVAEHNGINNCSIDNGPNPKRFGQMQLAPDGQIYISLAVQCNDVHIIRHPNVRGRDCTVEQNAIILPTFVFGTIPTFNTYRLGPLDGSPCDTLGLNEEPVSRFWYEQDSMDFLSVQFWDVSYFRPKDWQWTFGDGATSSERHPRHDYPGTGVYEVCLTVSNENNNHTSCQTLNIGVVSTEEAEVSTINLYPNPSEGYTRLVISDYLPADGYFRLFDTQGRLLLTQKVRTGSTILDLTAVPAGTYIYELRDAGRLFHSGKVVRMD